MTESVARRPNRLKMGDKRWEKMRASVCLFVCCVDVHVWVCGEVRVCVGGACVCTHMCLRGCEAFSIHMMNGDDEQYGTSQPDKTKAKE